MKINMHLWSYVAQFLDWEICQEWHTLYVKINMHLWSYLAQFLDWEICQEWHTLYMKINIHLWSYLAQFFLDWEIFQTEFVEKVKIHIICSTIFYRKSCPLWDNRDRPQMTVWHTRFACWITKVTDTHSRMCNTHCVSTVTMDTRTPLIVTLDAYFLCFV
jgi:hypothetical protein